MPIWILILTAWYMILTFQVHKLRERQRSILQDQLSTLNLLNTNVLIVGKLQDAVLRLQSNTWGELKIEVVTNSWTTNSWTNHVFPLEPEPKPRGLSKKLLL